MTNRPLAFIDVDGVLNHFVSEAVASARGLLKVTVVPRSLPMEFTVYLDPEDRGRLDRLAESFDLAWATTWEDDAPELLAPYLGLPTDWPVARIDPSDASKARGILDIAGERPFVWFDDAVAETDRTVLDAAPNPNLVIDVPAPWAHGDQSSIDTGLTDGLVDLAVEWASRF